MIDAPTQALLQNLFRREGRSMLQYVHESFPWTTPTEQEVLAQLDQLVMEERNALAALSRLLMKRHVAAPYLGPYPMSFTSINFVSVDFLLPLLVEKQQQAVAVLEKDLARIADEELRTQVAALVEMKRRHGQKLQELAKAKSLAAAS